MRFITLLMAVGIAASAYAQREYRTIEDIDGNRQVVTVDDVYATPTSTRALRGYDNVQYVTDGVSRTLIVHQREEQVFHTDNVVRRDMGWVQTPKRLRTSYRVRPYGGAYYTYQSGYYPTRPRSNITNGSGTQIVNYGNNVSFNVTPAINSSNYQRVTATNVAVMEWYIQFNIGSSLIGNGNYHTFADIKRFALENPSFIYYIDGYADANTGTSDGNYVLATNRVNAVVQFLLNEGSPFERSKLFTASHRDQEYGNNNMNRCVTIKAVNGHNQ